jgi:hypothetical protein
MPLSRLPLSGMNSVYSIEAIHLLMYIQDLRLTYACVSEFCVFISGPKIAAYLSRRCVVHLLGNATDLKNATILYSHSCAPLSIVIIDVRLN